MDFRVDDGLFDHPKFIKLTRKLGPESGIGLLRVWAFAAANRPEGRLTDMDSEDIAIAARWEGDADEFVTTLLRLRWLDDDGDMLAIHDWNEHQPWITGAPARKAKALRAAKARWGKSDDAMGSRSRCSGHAVSNAQGGDEHYPFPSPSIPNQTNSNGEPPSGSPSDGCPVDNIKDLYNEILSDRLPKARVLTAKRAAYLRQRWAEDGERRSLGWWSEYFASVLDCPHLLGTNDRGWRADFEWLINPNNLIKVLEGRYRRRPKATDAEGDGIDRFFDDLEAREDEA